MKSLKANLEITAAILTIVATLLTIGYLFFFRQGTTTSEQDSRDPVGPSTASSNPDDWSEADWQSLFNGKDLTGWSRYAAVRKQWKPINEGWQIHEGTIVCTTNESTALTTDSEFGDFVIELEFQLPAAGFFIVGLRTSLDAKDAVAVPMLDEVRFREIRRTESRSMNNAEVVLAIDKISEAMRPPGEWNRLRLHCEQDELRGSLNGVAIGDFPIKETFDVDRPTGRIAILSAEGLARDTVFRKVKIHELK